MNPYVLVTTFAISLLSASKYTTPVDKSREISQIQATNSFSVYCTSNQDSTGTCNRTDNNNPVSCLIIPGGIINCKQEGEAPIQCVLYSSTLDSQGYFFCTRRTDPGIRTNRLNVDRITPLPGSNKNTLDPNTYPVNPIPNSLSDPFNQ